MGQRARRRYCTAAESAEIWDRWQRGEGLKSIGRLKAATRERLVGVNTESFAVGNSAPLGLV